jgi:hypothetical protein
LYFTTGGVGNTRLTVSGDYGAILENGLAYNWLDSTGSYITQLAAENATATRTITLPDQTGTVAVYSADGTNGQVLTTDGSGNLSFTTVSGGSGGDMSWQSAWPDDPDTVNTANIPIGSGTLAVVQSTAQGNVAIGKDALNDLTTGDFNTTVGQGLGHKLLQLAATQRLGKTLFSSQQQALTTQPLAIRLYITARQVLIKLRSDMPLDYMIVLTVIALMWGAQTQGTAYSTNGVAIGYQAKIGGNNEVNIGYQAGAGQISNDYNVYVGAYAGNYNTSSKTSKYI